MDFDFDRELDSLGLPNNVREELVSRTSHLK